MKSSKSVRKDGTVKIIYLCRACNTERCRKYRETEVGKQAARRAVAKYEGKRKNKIKRKAWGISKTVPLKPCEICGSKKADRCIADYKKPLEVRFYCRAHHKAIHKKS